MTDEEFVRAHWERVEWRGSYEHGDGLEVGGKRFTVPNSAGNPELYLLPAQALEVWAAAAEFTRERLEQVRQLEREILVLGNLVDMYARDVYRCINGTCSILGRDLEGAWAMCAYTVSRTIARLESALADLRKGMRA